MIIKNIEDLIQYQSEEFKMLGSNDFNADLLIHTPGLPQTDIEKLKAKLPDIPATYLEAIQKVDVNGINIGYFCLSPLSGKNRNLIDKVLYCKRDTFFPKEFMDKHNVYQIGFHNTDLICVTSGTSWLRNGEILYIEEGYDITNPNDNQILKLSKDFEQFLIVAGNLNQLHREIKDDDSNYEEKKKEFLDRLKKLDVSEEYHKAWLDLF